MSDTKMAISALMGLTVRKDFGPEWLQAIVAVVQFACLGYLIWYVWRGPDVIERRPSRRRERP